MGEHLASEPTAGERRSGHSLAGPTSERARAIRPAVYAWAILGVTILLVQGLVKMVPIALQAIQGPLSLTERTILWSFVAMNLYLEGYRGFQLRFVPRVVARALHLAKSRDAATWFVGLAPFFAMGFFHAKRRARLSAWILTGLIALAVVAVRHLPAPWRGIVDAGVVAGLGYGTLSLVHQAFVAAFTGVARVDAELP